MVVGHIATRGGGQLLDCDCRPQWQAARHAGVGGWSDEALRFGKNGNSAKGRNIAQNPEIAIHLESGDDVVILYGKAEAIAEEAALNALVSAYDARYSIKLDPFDDATTLLAFRPTKVLAWRESDFPNPATRWQM